MRFKNFNYGRLITQKNKMIEEMRMKEDLLNNNLKITKEELNELKLENDE